MTRVHEWMSASPEEQADHTKLQYGDMPFFLMKTVDILKLSIADDVKGDLRNAMKYIDFSWNETHFHYGGLGGIQIPDIVMSRNAQGGRGPV